MDPLLHYLQGRGLGPSVGTTYAGTFIHADDIRTVSSSITTLQEQIESVHRFAVQNGLSLNPTKCEVLLISSTKPANNTSTAILGGQVLVAQHQAKCLGHWWSWDLSASRAVDEAIKRARRAFFAFGAMGGFQGKLNPISTRCLFETCVVPVLLYGCENWILTDQLLHQLESFQAETGRRMLQLSRFHSGLSTRLALKWPCAATRILIKKLSLLSRVKKSSEENQSIGGRIFSSLTNHGHTLKLVKECRSLEGKLKSHGHTDALLNGQSTLKDIKRHLFEQDWESSVTEASHHDSTAVAAAISSSVSWLKLWDMALDHGPHATHSLQLLYRTLTRPSFQSKCRLCEPETALSISYFHHFVHYHTPINPDCVINSLTCGGTDIFLYAKYFIQ